MKLTRANSSNVHSHGHSPETGLVMRFHDRTCKNRANNRRDACDCEGGGLYHYPTVSAEQYADLCAADSIGSHFMKEIRNAKDDQGKPKHPATFVPVDAPKDPA